MQINWKKLSLASLACLFVTSAFAERTQSLDPSFKPKMEEESDATKMEPAHAIEQNQLHVGYNAPANINTKGVDVYVKTSFIYWQAMEENLQLGSTELAVPSPTSGKVYEMDFDFKPGFKVALGSTFGQDRWDLNAEYTWYHAKNNKTFNPNENIDSLRLDGDGIFFVNKMHAKWNLNMDLLDIAFGRSYYVGTHVILHPSFSISGARINQKYFENFRITDAVAGVYRTFFEGNVHNWGIGPKICLDANWMFSKDFGLFTNLAAGVLYSHYKVKHDSIHVLDSNTGSFVNFHTTDKFYALRPVVDIACGLNWGTYLYDDAYHLAVSLAYEVHVFWNQENFSSQFLKGDLYTNGANLALRFDF